jgi:nitroreductase
MTAEAMKMGSAIMENAPDRVGSAILDVFRRRWSPKAFSSRPVELEKLRGVLEAARWAPSSVNEQPSRFILARKGISEEYTTLLGCLNNKNQEWAQYAPVLVLSIAKLNLTRNGELNRHALHDVRLATANLIVEASALGRHTHAMGAFSIEKTRATLGIPDGYEPVTIAALG